MALEDIFAFEEHTRAAGAGELGEEALVEEVRRRYRKRGGGSLVDLLLDAELVQARSRLTTDERFLAMMHQANEYERESERIRRHLEARQALVEQMRQAEELGRIRRAKSRGGKRCDPRRAAVVAFIASRLSDSDYFDNCGAIWA